MDGGCCWPLNMTVHHLGRVDGDIFLTHHHGDLYMTERGTGNVERRLQHIGAFALSPDATTFAVSTRDEPPRVRIHDAISTELVTEWELDERTCARGSLIQELHFSPNGRWMLADA